MYSFYGGQKGQDFKISRIFSNRAVDMLGDLKMRWTSPVGVGEYVFISYGDPSYMNEENSTYNKNLQIDLKASGKSYTNSLWQKIYVDKNLEVSPDFPDGDNNVYIFLNLDDTESEEYGNSLKESSDLETEENFGLGYRLIACVTGVTPRIRVFHQVINLEDGDPYVTLDLTNPDTPKIKFYLQRGQRINDLFTTTIGPQEKPFVDYIVDSNFIYKDKNGENQKATLTNPYVNFHLPKAPALFMGSLFGKGPLSFFHNMGYLASEENLIGANTYTIYESESNLISQISTFIRSILISDLVSYEVVDGKINLIDANHFFLKINEENNEYTNGIYVQNNGKCIINILGNQELINKTIEFRQKLIKDYSLSNSFINGENINEETLWHWIRPETKSDVYIVDLFKSYYPISLYSVWELIYAIFKYLMVIEEQTEPFYIDNNILSQYILSLFDKFENLGYHFNDIYKNGFIGDLYINEPNGKIYEINKIKNKSINAIYLGTITAPAPKAETENIPAFFDAGNGIYKKQQAYVRSSVKDLNNTDLYQEVFTFELPNNPTTNFITKNTDNNKNYNISEPIIKNENEQIFEVSTPMPIHIFTPGDNSGLFIDVNGFVSQNKNQYDGVPFGLGDLFINITENNSNAYQGNIYRCQLTNTVIEEGLKNNTLSMKDIWGVQPIGNIQGNAGIPIATQVVNMYANVPNDLELNFNPLADVVYVGLTEGTNDIFNYYVNMAQLQNKKIIDIITNSLLAGKNIQVQSSDQLPTFNVNFENGDVILINYFNTDDNLQSFWAVKVDGIWNLISFAQDSSILFNNKKINNYNERQYQLKGYSIQYLEPRLQTIENTLEWYDWD